MITELDEFTKFTVLSLIAEHNGQWGWYQLDRALAARGTVGVHWPTVMDKLQRDGLASAVGDAQLAATHYFITESGQSFLRSAQPRM